jgi:hypothetical protein
MKEPECSLPYAQDPETCPYPEPDQSSKCPFSRFLKIHFPPAEAHVHCLLRASYQRINPSLMLREVVSNVVALYGELLALRQTPKLEDHPLSVVRDWLFLYSAFHIRGRSSIQNLRTHHAVVTGTLLVAMK